MTIFANAFGFFITFRVYPSLERYLINISLPGIESCYTRHHINVYDTIQSVSPFVVSPLNMVTPEQNNNCSLLDCLMRKRWAGGNLNP